MKDSKNTKLAVVAGVLFIAALAAFFWPRGGDAVAADVEKGAQEANQAYQEELAKSAPAEAPQASPTFRRKAQSLN